MITIRLLDARRGLNLKCRELFKDERIAEEIYRFLCDGIEECENAEPERKKGRWLTDVAFYDEEGCPCIVTRCDQCGEVAEMTAYCPHCGASMTEGAEDAGREH